MEQNTAEMSALTADREKIIVRTSFIGIGANVLLAAFKAIVGLLSHSIAVVLDAVNNLSDALSSVITIIGAKLGAKQPNKKHPLGYGRVEYISSMLVAAIVLYAGITSLVESVKKIFHPEKADYSALTLVIIAVAIVVKLILGAYVKAQGEKVNSGALVASGSDALFDAVLSASVLASAVICLIWNISLEAYVGVIIACFIIKAGIEMMLETLDDIIGQRSDAEITASLRKLICEDEDVRGAYDIILFNYGPNKNYGTVHIELPDTMTVDDVDRITRRIQINVFQKTGVILTGVGVYSYNTTNDEAARIRNALQKAVLSNEWAMQMHGFYADTENKTLRYDVVVSFDIDREQAQSILSELTHKMYPDYAASIVLDTDTSD